MLITAFCATSPTAHAHVLESDNGISAVLHIPPEDSPVAGEETTFKLTFSSTGPDFDINRYLVKATLSSADFEPIAITMTTEVNSPTEASAVLTVPKPGGYILQVEGAPLHGRKPFGLEFNVLATVPAGGTADGKIGGVEPDFWVLNAAALAILATVAHHAIRTGGRYPKPVAKNRSEQSHRKTPVQH